MRKQLLYWLKISGQNLVPFNQKKVDLINMRIVRWLMVPTGKLSITLIIPLTHFGELLLACWEAGHSMCVCVFVLCRQHCWDTSEVSASGSAWRHISYNKIGSAFPYSAGNGHLPLLDRSYWFLGVLMPLTFNHPQCGQADICTETPPRYLQPIADAEQWGFHGVLPVWKIEALSKLTPYLPYRALHLLCAIFSECLNAPCVNLPSIVQSEIPQFGV